MRISQAEYIAMQARIDSSRLKPRGSPEQREVGKGGIQDEIEQFLKSLGPKCWYDVKRSDKRTTSREGVPDFVGVYMGVPFAIEAKARGKKPTVEQLGELKWLELAGAKTIVAYSRDEVVEFMKGLLK